MREKFDQILKNYNICEEDVSTDSTTYKPYLSLKSAHIQIVCALY